MRFSFAPARCLRAAAVLVLLAACSAKETKREEDFAFDGTCANCHAGLAAGHVHANYKLRCIDCHGGNDQVAVPVDAHQREADYRNPTLIGMAHVQPKMNLARFFYANGLDDDRDGRIDETVEINGATVTDFGEVFEPGLHGQGAGEFFDTELSRDLNYTRFLNPGDLRVATIGCGSANGASNAAGCHQQTIDVVRRSIMVNQSAVINGAYYGNESWRSDFQNARGNEPDPRAGAFGYTLDYQGADTCIRAADPAGGERAQPRFDSACLEARAALQDPAVAAGAPGNVGLPAFEIAQGDLRPVIEGTSTIAATGAGDPRLPWGPTTRTGDVVDIMRPTPNKDIEFAPGTPDPVDVILRTFRAYYPLNYPGSTSNFNFTFGTSIIPEIARFRTANPYGRGHSSGCSACHAPYAYDGSRRPTRVRQDDGTFVDVVDPTTKHREFDPAKHDRGVLAGRDRLIGRAVSAQEQTDTGRAQQRTYSANHALTTKIDTDTCGLCHGFVTRINLAYQGMAEEEQRDALARRKAIAFTTPAPKSTQVVIHDSWVREDNISGQPVVVEPAEAKAVIERARARDAMLAQQGLVAGAGGCAQAVFTEDCNNNGELDTALVLQRLDESGKVVAEATINEDANGNGRLDLIDRIPRDRAIDGRQMRYVYGGRNGSTRLMDVHFERGMHCIDCHFLQDVHGDGHIYSTNWDAIEIECEDCHGTDVARATLVTSGPNGGNDLTRAVNDDRQPFFERKGNTFIQRSRVTPGVFWRIPQTFDAVSAYAREAHRAEHIGRLDANNRGTGSTFAGTKLESAKLDCHTCHSSWVHNCLGCHVEMNLGDPQRKHVQPNLGIVDSAAENEVWFSNAVNRAHVNFQLLGMLRSPFVLGVGSKAEAGRLMPFRSSMQVHLTVTGADRNTALSDVTFTTFQAIDGNSGRPNVATSAVAMNQTMPHTTRPKEARGCETCHALVDAQGRVRNEHLLAQTYGLGTGSYPFIGDWLLTAGTGGIELVEHKQERELAASVGAGSTRFPGMIVNPATRTLANIEPTLDGVFLGATARDVVLIRNFNPAPAMAGGTAPPTLKDLAVFAVDGLTTDALVITDVTGRGHPSSARASISTTSRTSVVTLPAAPTALAHLAPDVSDPFVYVALGASGVSVVEIRNVPGTTNNAVLRTTVPLAGKTITRLALAGDILYAGTAQGTIETFTLTNPAMPVHAGTTTVGQPVNDLAIAGFMMYVATPGGVGALSLDDPQRPAPPRGTGNVVLIVGNTDAKGIAVREGKAYIAGSSGAFELDLRTPGLPATAVPLTASALVNPQDLVISGTLPGQTWVFVLEGNGNIAGIKLDNTKSTRERCFPDPKAQCKPLDMQLLDPTVLGRDPGFDPVANQFDPFATDPSGPPFFRITAAIVTAGQRLARPAIWDAMGTLTGRRYRDSFMPGAGVLSLEVMQRMHAYEVCELPGDQPSTNPSGLGELGSFVGNQCVPFTGQSSRTLPACRPRYFGGPTVCDPPQRASR